jgi:ribosome biogenesis GTPase A
MERYKLTELPQHEEELIEAIGRKRSCIKSGGRVDLHKASVILINEIRDKTLGAISFEIPDIIATENAHFEALEEKRIAAREAKKTARGRGRKNKR